MVLYKVIFNNAMLRLKWLDAVSGKTFKTVNPSTEEVIAEVAEADKADVDKAVAAARKAMKIGR